MSDNVLQTLQRLVQDVIAPDVRELKVRVEEMDKRIDSRFDAMHQLMESMQRQMDANTKTLLAAIAESKAQSELTAVSAVAAVRERVAVLEAKHN